MDVLINALTESVAHGIFTVELGLGVLIGLTFIAGYARSQWWITHGGRLTMGNMVAITCLAAGGFLFRLGWQGEALTVLIPSCAVVLWVQCTWVRTLWKSRKATVWDDAADLSVTLEAFADRLVREGRAGDAEAAFKHARVLDALGRQNHR